MDKKILRNNVIQTTKEMQENNQIITAIDEMAATQSEINNLPSRVAKEAMLERINQYDLMMAANDWEYALKVYERGRKNYFANTTLVTYMGHLKTFHDWLKQFELDKFYTPTQITTEIIEEYIDHNLNMLHNSRRTTNDKLYILKNFFGFLASKNVITKSPAAPIARLPMYESPIYSFTPEQMQKLFAVIPLNTWRGARDNSIFRMLVETGCRTDEAYNFEIPNIVFENGIPQLLKFKETKNKRYREVAITAKLAEAIIIWLQKRREYGITDHQYPVLHIGVELKPPCDSNIRKYFKQYCRKAGIDKDGVRCSPYTLKHTFCKLFLLAGGRENELREIVGHIDERSLTKYTRLTNVEAMKQHKQKSPSLIFNF
jgi:integrase/recombinase XerD